MKTKKITYFVFVTSTLVSAFLLYLAVHIADPVSAKYERTVAELCLNNESLVTESDALQAYPDLFLAKEKLELLKAVRCQMQRMMASPVSPAQDRANAEFYDCKENVAKLINEINCLLDKIDGITDLASML